MSVLDTWLARLGREGERGHTEFDNHLAPWDIAFPELETIGDAAPSTELDGFPVGRAGVLVFRAGVGDAADSDGEERVGVGEGGGVVAEELSARGVSERRRRTNSRRRTGGRDPRFWRQS